MSSERPYNPRLRGMTLVEIMVAVGVAAILMAGVMSVVIALARTAVKTERLERVATQARSIQELLTQELNTAINIYDTNAEIRNRPTFADGNGESPASYRQITYRVPVGPPGRLVANISISSTTVTFFARAALKPVVGDYLILDTPKLGRGILITAVTDNRAANSDGNVTVTLAESIDAGTVAGYEDDDLLNAEANSRVEIQRERSFIVDAPAPDAATTTLRWVENVSAGSSRTLTPLISAAETHLFRQVPEEATAEETAISWFLVLLDPTSTSGLTGQPIFFTTSSVSGTDTGSASSLIIPKSGNSLTLSNPFAAVSTSISTTTTSTSTSTTSTSSTTSKSTTKTTSTSTTSKSTTKTTSVATTSKSTTKTTSKATTSTTSKSTTKTTSVATTSKSTTKTTSTTSASTSKSTSTATTSKTTTKSTIPFDG